MKLRTSLIFGSLILLFTLSLLTIPLCKAPNFPSDSFCVDDVRDTDFIWEVTLLDDPAYSEPESFNDVGDQLKWKIDQFSTITVGEFIRDQIYGIVSYKAVLDDSWIPISSGSILLGEYAHSGVTPYTYHVDHGPMVAPSNATAIFMEINEIYDFENNNITSWTPSGLLIVIGIFNGTPFLEDEEYQELAFNKDGILKYWLKALGNGTAWVPVFRLEYQEAPGIPGFPIISTILALNFLLIIYIVIPKKQQISNTN
ncbi:MAG TPA: hypothetical protein VMV49_10840 [Candidatus Deferrimicrobium sp.]|nr:hypothetical protein [Candidatus Deferrimicrobium sp.]